MASTAATAEDFLTFVNASPSPYHATAEAERRLLAAGYTRLAEREPWSVSPGGKYFVVRNQSAYCAFAVGGKWDGKASGGFSIAATHTDSPCLRVKPISSLSKAGYLSVGVETYGGGLWYSWLDRDLSLAGRAVVATGAAPGGAAPVYDVRLVRVARPLLRIPSLAIHLNRDVNSEGLKLNAENHLAPILATAVKAGLGIGDAKPPAVSPAGTGGAITRHHAGLVSVIADELGVAPEAVKDFDLCLYDTQPAALGGLHKEFIFSPRLDNLLMTSTVLSGLLDGADGGLAADGSVRMVAAFDHEEVGSGSVPGASSTLLEDVMRRLVVDPVAWPAIVRKSILVSADMAHAVHPNYAALHEENHRPAMHGGIVIKSNANQRYATTNVTAFLFRQLAAEAGVPVQNFVVRQDMGCGSTIGPICASRLGIRTVDVGVPQLSMHSIREVCGADDAGHARTFFAAFFARYPALDASMAHAD